MQLSGCWMVFIPGSLVQKATDAVTGAEGEHCVRADIKPGESIRLTSGGTGTVVSVSGKSMKCTAAVYPIRALVAVDTGV